MKLSSWEDHLFLWAIYTMAMLVITRWYTSTLHKQERAATSDQPPRSREMYTELYRAYALTMGILAAVCLLQVTMKHEDMIGLYEMLW
jgi:hypothetical protein